MTTIQLTGKPAEVREQFAELTLPEDALICLTVDELTPEMQVKQENAEMMRKYDEEFAHYPRVNGIIQVPSSISLTPDEVKEMLCRMEMEEVLGENWDEVAEQMHQAYEASLRNEEKGEAAAA